MSALVDDFTPIAEIAAWDMLHATASAGLDYLADALAGDFNEAEAGGSALTDERASLALTAAGYERLVALGVDRRLLFEMGVAGDLAVAQVDLHRGGLFQFGGPDRRLIVAVRRWGTLVDLLAVASHDENEWALRLGAGEFLGEDLLLEATVWGARELRLFSTPMAWLRGGGRGICVLDWTAGALAALRGLGPGVTLVCDAGAKARLQALLAHGGLPLVAEDRPMMGRAA